MEESQLISQWVQRTKRVTKYKNKNYEQLAIRKKEKRRN